MNAAIDNVYAIILAAGASSRMGSPKQLLKWQGRPLLEHAVVNARALLDERVAVVLGANAGLIQATIDLGDITTIINPDWREGMASSIRAGVLALPASAAGALILLCDQPLLNAAHIQKLLLSWQQTPNHIIACQYHHAVGVPALFPSVFFGELLALNGDSGAKPLFMKFANNLLKIPLPEAEIDIDCALDYDRLINHCSGGE